MLILQVTLTVGFGGEPIVAKLALERLFTGVSSHVTSQRALVIARVGTRSDVAAVRSFAKMLFVVTLERSQIWINSRTKSAGKFSSHFHISN
jgi:hypothetical protein